MFGNKPTQPPQPLQKLDLFGSRSSDLFHSDLYASKSDLYSPKSDIYGSRRELFSLKGDIYGSKSEFLYSRRELYSPKGRGEEGGGGRGEGVWQEGVGGESGNFYESDSGVSSLYEPLSFHNGGLDSYGPLRNTVKQQITPKC